MPAERRLPLPPLPTIVNGRQGLPRGVFVNATQSFVDTLAAQLSGRRVLEVFSGNGFLAAHLAKCGIQITATSLRSGHDAHAYGFFHDVEECDAREAVLRHGEQHDVLLMAWPTVTEAAIQAVRLWVELAHAMGRPGDLVFVGEVTDYRKNHLGGCATDAFFEEVEIFEEIPVYAGNMLEKAFWGRYCKRAAQSLPCFSRR